MSLLLKTSILTTYLFFLLNTHSYSQSDPPPYRDPNYGADSASRVECANELSTLAEFMKIDLYDYALPSWRSVYRNCPASSKNIFISGAKIFTKKIEEAKEPSVKEAYFDTLMMIYENRMVYFGEEGYVLGRKGIDIIRFNDKDFDQAYEAFAQSAHLLGKETDINVLTGLVQTSSFMMRVKKIEPLVFLDDFINALNILEEKKASGEDPGKIDKVRGILDKIILSSNLRDCNTLEEVFTPKLAEGMNPDADLLKLAEKLLSSSGCTNSAFYSGISTRLLEISPDPKMAYEVAKYNIRNDNFEVAADYLRKAIDSEENPEQIAYYQYQLGVILSQKLGLYQEANEMARLSTKNNPAFGEPYLLIATNLISGIKTCDADAFDRSAIYWLAIDYCIKAIQVDPLMEAKANELISQYRQSYPNKEETFFRSLNPGDNYSFGCWINESTTVKEKQ